MARGRGLTALVAVAAAVGAAVLLRRRAAATGPRVDLYFADGSMLPLGADAPEADEVLRRARQAAGSPA